MLTHYDYVFSGWLELSFEEFLAEGEQQEAKRRAVPAFEVRPAHTRRAARGSRRRHSSRRPRKVDPLLFMMSLQTRLNRTPPKGKAMPLLQKVQLEESYRLVRRTEVRQTPRSVRLRGHKRALNRYGQMLCR